MSAQPTVLLTGAAHGIGRATADGAGAAGDAAGVDRSRRRRPSRTWLRP